MEQIIEKCSTKKVRGGENLVTASHGDLQMLEEPAKMSDILKGTEG